MRGRRGVEVLGEGRGQGGVSKPLNEELQKYTRAAPLDKLCRNFVVIAHIHTCYARAPPPPSPRYALHFWLGLGKGFV